MKVMDKSKLYCICRAPLGDRRDANGMIQCVRCKEWFHLACIGFLPSRRSAAGGYACNQCKHSDGAVAAKRLLQANKQQQLAQADLSTKSLATDLQAHIEEEEPDMLVCLVCREGDCDPGLQYSCECRVGYHMQCFRGLLQSDPKWRTQCPSCRQTFIRLPLKLRMQMNHVISQQQPENSNRQQQSPGLSLKSSRQETVEEATAANKAKRHQAARQMQKKEDVVTVSATTEAHLKGRKLVHSQIKRVCFK
jgi:hypothetical protein